MESFLIFFVFLHANLRVFVEIELGNHLFGGGKSLKVGFRHLQTDELPSADDEGAHAYTLIYITEEIKNKINRKKQYG